MACPGIVKMHDRNFLFSIVFLVRDVGVASLRSIITKGCASWYPCDARPRISGMILLELPILGPVDLSSL